MSDLAEGDPALRLLAQEDIAAVVFGTLYFHQHYKSPFVCLMRRMRWAGYVARIGEKRNAYRILVGKPEGKSPLGTPRLR
jgi:hypothetical protein